MENKGTKYKEDYLTGVIVKIDFSNILKLSGNNKEAADEFGKYIFKEFPSVDVRVNNNINVKYDGNNIQTVMENGDFTWIFSDSNNTREVALNAESLILQYKKGAYIWFNQVLDDIAFLLDALEYYYPFEFRAINLRYINQINEEVINEENIKEYINPALTDNIIFDLDDDEKLSQILTRLDLIKDNYKLTFQYGFFNPSFPDPNFKKDFILDFDCNLRDMNLIRSKEDIINELKKMSTFIFNKFKYSITDKLEELMGEEK